MGRLANAILGLIGLALAAVPGAAGALGLGDITLESGLNQRLDARIALVNVKPGDLEGLVATLADESAFEAAGIPRGAVAQGLRFEVVPAAGGENAHIHVTSRVGIREPAVEFVLDVAWSRGRSLRHYSLLLSAR